MELSLRANPTPRVRVCQCWWPSGTLVTVCHAGMRRVWKEALGRIVGESLMGKSLRRLAPRSRPDLLLPHEQHDEGENDGPRDDER